MTTAIQNCRSTSGVGARALLSVALTTMVSAPAWPEIEISGLEDPLLANALTHIDLDEEPCDSPDWRVTEQFDRSHDELRVGLEAFGYYGSDIRSSLTFDESCWNAAFDVDPGEPVRIRTVDVSITGDAADDPVFERFLTDLVPASGEVLSHSQYDTLKRGLVEIGQRRGYAEAIYRVSRIDVYPDEYAADISLLFESGPRYRFGEVDVIQNSLAPELLERYFQFSPGDPYDRDRLNSLYGALVDSGYFDSIDVRPSQAVKEAREIPVSVQLTPARRRIRSYGVGYSTDTGPRFRFGRNNRRVNERGAQSGIQGQLSPVISEAVYNYRFPYGDPRSEWISFDAGVKHEDTETAVSDSLEFGVRRVVARGNSWQETQFLDLLVEDFRVADTKSRSRLLRPGIGWFNLRADDVIRPSAGRRVGFEISGAGDALGSDTSFLQLTADAKWIRAFGERNRVLIRAQAGITFEDDFNALPPTVRFFAGGDNSIRGYKFESLGPTDEDGNVIGGSRLIVASIEYERELTAKWSIATFLDSGNAFNRGNVDAKSGAGLGFRWQSPLGPIRVDLAKPLDGLDRDLRLHITLGADL